MNLNDSPDDEFMEMIKLKNEVSVLNTTIQQLHTYLTEKTDRVVKQD